MTRPWPARPAVLPTLLAVLVGASVAVMASRHGEAARFVTWPVVALVALAATVAGIGVMHSRARPWASLAMVAPAFVLSYLIAGLPPAGVAVIVAVLGVLALREAGPVAGFAAWVGAFVTVYTLLQAPAVRCGTSSVSMSEPWWVHSTAASASGSASGSAAPAGTSGGVVSIGDHTYAFACRAGRLTTFERAG